MGDEVKTYSRAQAAKALHTTVRTLAVDLLIDGPGYYLDRDHRSRYVARYPVIWLVRYAAELRTSVRDKTLPRGLQPSSTIDERWVAKERKRLLADRKVAEAVRQKNWKRKKPGSTLWSR